ncbi:hypothetical protein Scep_025745 [Stephania cephalantha]|uniref:Uncharacterized protein n=1 Tax=Stephania cephalantha TaxID=152367 RepID=A0AAP0HRV2_9MAGN
MPHLSFLLQSRSPITKPHCAEHGKTSFDDDEDGEVHRRTAARASEAATVDGEGFGGSNFRQTATADPTASSQSQSQRRQRFQDELLYSVSDPSLISNGSETELLHSVSDPSLISIGTLTECNNSISDPLLIHEFRL